MSGRFMAAGLWLGTGPRGVGAVYGCFWVSKCAVFGGATASMHPPTGLENTRYSKMQKDASLPFALFVLKKLAQKDLTGSWSRGLGMQIHSEFSLNLPNSLRIRSECEFAVKLTALRIRSHPKMITRSRSRSPSFPQMRY